MNSLDIPLLPPPHHISVTGGPFPRPIAPLRVYGCTTALLDQTIGRITPFQRVDRPESAHLEVRLDNRGFDVFPPSVCSQAYRLHIEPPRGNAVSVARLSAADERGIRHGLHTLAQLLHLFNPSLPELSIEDFPAFVTRGVMLDISRDRVPTMKHLFDTVDLLASIKLNHLQLYTEHTFAYAGHEEVWRGASPMTPAEIRELDTYCQQRGIDLAANQNTFGHMERWLAHPRYSLLAETHGKWIFDNGDIRADRTGPFSLCPTNSASIKLIEDLLDHLLPCFTSPLVNIGCDETFDVGQGRSADEVAHRGRPAVYFDFVNKVTDIVRRNNKRPMLWADIALSHPESLDHISPDSVALVWGYENEPARYDEWCHRLRDAGREFWVCPGTSSWKSIVGRSDVRSANIRAMAAAGLKHGATGFMITDWGDMGHRQQWPISLLGIAEAAYFAWSELSPHAMLMRETDLVSWLDAGLHVFRTSPQGLAARLDALGDSDLPIRAQWRTETGRPLTNASALFTDLQLSLGSHLHPGRIPEWLHVRETIDSFHILFDSVADPQIRAELLHTLDVALFAVDRAIARREPDSLTPHRRRNLADRLCDIIAEHRRLWLLRSRPGGLDHSCSYYESILNELTQ